MMTLKEDDKSMYSKESKMQVLVEQIQSSNGLQHGSNVVARLERG